MYTLKLQTQFSSAHQLINAYDSKCNDNLHGHNWKVLIEVQSSRLHKNMIVDFTKVKELIDTLDHKNLNTILKFEPTAENLSAFIHKMIESELLNIYQKDEFSVKITLWEADKASITYEKS